MSTTPPPVPKLEITEEQLAKISGGSCTVTEIVGVLDGLKDTYESLIDFTSYVIERVANSTNP